MMDKFNTQRKVTWYMFALVAAVIFNVCWKGDLAASKGIYDSLLPLFAGTLGYWIGTSKSSADKDPQPKETT